MKHQVMNFKSPMDFYNTVKKFVKEKQDKIMDLSERWIDEKGYEDFNDYRKIITEYAKEYGLIPEAITEQIYVTFIYKCKYHMTVKFLKTKIEIESKILK